MNACPMTHPADHEDEYKSKTQLKKESDALQQLGITLLQLTPKEYQQIPVDAELDEAIQMARRINRKKEGYRRQLQFIGKLMRSRDVEPIEIALQRLEQNRNLANVHFHQLEQLRDRLLAEGDSCAHELCQKHSELELQRLRQLIRQANKEAQQQKPPKAARELFKYLREQLPEL